MEKGVINFLIAAAILVVVAWLAFLVLGALKNFVLGNAMWIGAGLIVLAVLALGVAARRT